MCVLCLFYFYLELGGWKKLEGRNFFEIKTCYGRVTGNKQLLLGLIGLLEHTMAIN